MGANFNNIDERKKSSKTHSFYGISRRNEKKVEKGESTLKSVFFIQSTAPTFKSVAQKAIERGLQPNTVYARYRELGWSLTDALEKPLTDRKELIKRNRRNKYGDLVKNYDHCMYNRIVHCINKGIPMKKAIEICTTTKYFRVKDYV